jgi:ADP-ribose pyrophosphatase YjhB (NUDIX family)
MSDFPAEVQELLGPTLSAMGFSLDAIDDAIDDGGRHLSVVYYVGKDCKIQIYRSSREGETNCMIGTLDAPNEFGLRSKSKKWQYFTRFVELPDLPLSELARTAKAEYESFEDPLHWVKSRIENHFDAARTGILKMYG